MKLSDLIDPSDLFKARSDKLVNIRQSGDGQFIYNYSDAAMWTPGAWDNPAVRQCRGLITDSDQNVIARPWAKFFNHGQKEAGKLDLFAPVEVTDKKDGSLGIIHRATDGRLRIATRGSFESEQAIHATKIIRERYNSTVLCGITPLVEIVYPANRIVCNYGELDDLILLGGVDIQTGDYLGPRRLARLIEWEGPVTETFDSWTTLAAALASAPRTGAEGLTVRYLDEPRIVKIKQDDYVALHRIVTGLSERSVWEAICEGKVVTDLLSELPDELHGWTKDVWSGIESAAGAIESAVLYVHESILAELPLPVGRREYAERAVQQGALRPHLFTLLDARDPYPAILKSLKPAGCVRAITRTEDVA